VVVAVTVLEGGLRGWEVGGVFGESKGEALVVRHGVWRSVRLVLVLVASWIFLEEVGVFRGR